MNAGLKKVLRRGLIGIAATTAVIGAMHAPFARSLLKKVGGCPVGNVSAADVEHVRNEALLKVRGDIATPAPSRTPLGFAVGRATRDEILEWASGHGLRCEAKREGSLVACTDVPASALPDRRTDADGVISNLNFGFRVADGRLVNVTALSTKVLPREATVRARRVLDRMRLDLGDPSSADGEFTVDRLSRGGYATSTVAYRFHDYLAELTATSFDANAVTLREHYVAIGD